MEKLLHTPEGVRDLTLAVTHQDLIEEWFLRPGLQNAENEAYKL